MRYNLVVGRVSKQVILGIDGGATKTEWALCEMKSCTLYPAAVGRMGRGGWSFSTVAP